MIIRNKKRLTLLARDCQVADSFLLRLRGLIGKDNISDEYALMITPCNSIHMFFMRFNLDVIFIDKNNRVIHLIKNIKPWRFSKVIWSAKSAIELKPHSINESKTEVGDILEFLK